MTSEAVKTKSPTELANWYAAVRDQTTALVEPLSSEDACVQSMPDASPAKWHLAHTSWFFEIFVLEPTVNNYTAFDPDYRILFNSYYNGVGAQFPRPDRGLLTRPGLTTIRDYRQHVDEHMYQLLAVDPGDDIAGLVEIGLHHEQQHQELILMDIKHLLSMNPTAPCYQASAPSPTRSATATQFIDYAGGLVTVGADRQYFAFDNERPRHQAYVADFVLASHVATNGDFLAFIESGAYEDPLLWLADGWATIRANNWRAPLYWRKIDGEWYEFTLHGLEKLQADLPVVHVSYYEAEAFARWSDARLPTEFEWEVAADGVPLAGVFVDSGELHPQAPSAALNQPSQLFGNVWEWTQSAYSAYPGYLTPDGAIGEYNGKFMSGQMVLRGGCCATPMDHIRATYRNFFYPTNRWQFGGIRLAR